MLREGKRGRRCSYLVLSWRYTHNFKKSVSESFVWILGRKNKENLGERMWTIKGDHRSLGRGEDKYSNQTNRLPFCWTLFCGTSDLLPWATAFLGWYPVVLTPLNHLLLSPSCHRLLFTHHFVIGSYSLFFLVNFHFFRHALPHPALFLKTIASPSHYLSSSSSAGFLHYNPFCVCIVFLCYSSPFPPAPPSSCFS